MVNRRQEAKEAIEHSFDTKISDIDMEWQKIREEKIADLYEITDMGELGRDDISRVLEGLDFLNTPIMELAEIVGKRVKLILSGKPMDLPVADTDMSPEKQNEYILNKMNEGFSSIGSQRKASRIPPMNPEIIAIFKNKKLVMVDDESLILSGFVPSLTAATKGNASFIKHEEGQSAEELAKKIMEHNPDVVLMDYNLLGKVKGPNVIRELKKMNFMGDAVGFSSDNTTEKEFMDAGAKGLVYKVGNEPISDLAKLIAGK